MEDKIIIRQFVEPWLGTIHLKSIFEIDKDWTTLTIYEVVGADDIDNENVGGFVSIDKEKDRRYGGEHIEFVSKEVIDVIMNYRNDKQ
jgi:hypothetical protein